MNTDCKQDREKMMYCNLCKNYGCDAPKYQYDYNVEKVFKSGLGNILGVLQIQMY